MTDSSIKSIISRVLFSEEMIEAFMNSAITGKTAVNEKINIPGQFECIAWRSAHVPVQGNIEIVFDHAKESEPIQVPVSTGFIVGCIKNETSDFKIAWSRSLS